LQGCYLQVLVFVLEKVCDNNFHLVLTAEMMHCAVDEPVVRSLVPSFANDYRQDAVKLDLPKPFVELYHVNQLSYADLLTKCASVMPILTVTTVQLRIVCLF